MNQFDLSNCAASPTAIQQTTIPQAAEAPIPSQAAKRMRRHRQRRRDGTRCLTIELRETEIEGLIRRELLKPEMRNNRNAIVQALYSWFDRTIGAQT